MPSGVTTRAHTRSAGASTMLCCSITMTVQDIPANRVAGGYVWLLRSAQVCREGWSAIDNADRRANDEQSPRQHGQSPTGPRFVVGGQAVRRDPPRGDRRRWGADGCRGGGGRGGELGGGRALSR